MNSETVVKRHIVLDTVTADGGLVWSCSNCYWKFLPTRPKEAFAAPSEAVKTFNHHDCADYRSKRLAA